MLQEVYLSLIHISGYGYNVLGQPKEMLLKFNTEFKSPVAEGFIVYNPAYLKITGLKTEKKKEMCIRDRSHIGDKQKFQ